MENNNNNNFNNVDPFAGNQSVPPTNNGFDNNGFPPMQNNDFSSMQNDGFPPMQNNGGFNQGQQPFNNNNGLPPIQNGGFNPYGGPFNNGMNNGFNNNGFNPSNSNPQPQQPAGGNSGAAVAGLVLGIMGFVGTWIGLITFFVSYVTGYVFYGISFLMGIAGVILASTNIKANRGVGIAGTVLASIAIGLSTIWMLTGLAWVC